LSLCITQRLPLRSAPGADDDGTADGRNEVVHRAPPPRSGRPARRLHRRRRGPVTLTLGFLLSACAHATPPAATTGPPPTAPGVTATGTAAAPTTAPATTEPSIPPPTTPAVPDPRGVPVSTLLRPGTSEVRTLYGDLNGDGVEEIVVAARRTTPPPGAVLAQGYLDVFSWNGRAFARVFAATKGAPQGGDVPATMIQVPRAEQVSQEMQFLALVGFRTGGPPDLALGILNVGAGAGPLDVWVVSMDAGGFHTEFFEETVSGGILTTSGSALQLDTPNFAPSDPHCCPSRIERQEIGLDPASGAITVLRRTFTRAR